MFREEIIKSLLSIKSSLRDTADPGIIMEIDKTIEMINKIDINSVNTTSINNELLNILGKLFDKLPGIVTILKIFND